MLNLSTDAKKLLQEGMTPSAYIEALMENKHYVPAIDFMAHALPLREGVWWGCLCMQHACGDLLTPQDRAAATSAVRWVMQPSEENRLSAKEPAEAVGPATPAGALAMALTLKGLSSAKAVASAVKLASIKAEPVQVAGLQKSFVVLAVAVAEGRFL